MTIMKANHEITRKGGLCLNKETNTPSRNYKSLEQTLRRYPLTQAYLNRQNPPEVQVALPLPPAPAAEMFEPESSYSEFLPRPDADQVQENLSC